jgi:spermidine synthase
MKLSFQVKLALILSGASALIYEVVATDVLFFYFIKSSYSIATVLSVFLAGLGLGSLLIHVFSKRIKNKVLLFGLLQILIAIYGFLVLRNLTSIIPTISTWGTFITSFLILLIPTIFLGAIFPLSSYIIDSKKNITGLIYSLDLLGAIMGSLLAGFLLIPLLGVKAAVLFGVGLNIISALFVLPKKYKLIPIFFLAFLLITFAVSQSMVNVVDDYDFFSNSPYGEVRVENSTLYIEKREQCSLNYPKNATERLMASYSLSHMSDDLDVLVIGLGCGLTVDGVLEYDAKIDVVEINPQVVLANQVMTGTLKNPRVNLVIDEGLNYLRNTNKKYDSILVDVENPAIAHSSDLYTVEAFEIISNSLKDSGTFGLWNYGVVGEYKDVLYYSLNTHFPFVYSERVVFIASRQELNHTGYQPNSPYRLNTIDKNVLSEIYCSGNVDCLK